MLLLPLLAGWLVWREVRFGFRMQELAARIEVVDERSMDEKDRRRPSRPLTTGWRGTGSAWATSMQGDKKQARAALDHAWDVRDR